MTDIKMPDLATADSEVTLIRWLVEVGQPVKLGQPLLEIETDKASMDVESVAAGILTAIHAQSGERVAVGQHIATIESSVERSIPVTQSMPAAVPLMPTAAPPVKEIVVNRSTARVSLFARNKAARLQRTHHTTVTLNSIQREVARRTQHSKQTIPHYYLTTSANAERLVVLRQEAAQRTPPQKIVWDAFFVQAVAKALISYDKFRYRLDNDQLIRRPTDAIGVAADVDNDLYVVPVENPLSLTLEQISQHIADQIARIKQGDPLAKRLAETSITITNLGSEKIETFAAIINPPEVAILAIGKIAPVVHVENDQMVIQKRVSLSLSVDHRVINGKYAAAFLSRVVDELEVIS